jgi:hypothetical protein
MIGKLSGLVLIINTLLPAVFLVLVVGTGVFLWQTLEREVVSRIDVIADGFNSLKTEAEKAAGTVRNVVSKAKESATEVTMHAKKSMDALSPLVTQVEALRKSIDSVVKPIAGVKIVYPEITTTKSAFEFDQTYKIIGRIHLGPFTYLTGGKLSKRETSPFANLRTPFDNIAVALDTMSTEVELAKASATDAAKEIVKLEPLIETFIVFKDKFGVARAALVGISGALRGTLRPVAWVFGTFVLLAIPWLAVSYVIWSLARLKRGYALLTG